MNFIRNKDFLEFGRADETLINDLLQNQPIQTHMNKNGDLRLHFLVLGGLRRSKLTFTYARASEGAGQCKT